ncbi:adenylate isopentenyltransferase 3, chloroplastic-like [Lolium perenne]|jgi:adenylate isopentenyltransferase (cytokinin synthase)|uniref:adenylate isopentenyltransferase 3, chloroplastic-like n=1 Tax=Lolium perenne TaxID=4522 RepID=UPI0021F5843C|nr:adenylate isopentenyltransferase 3, chloroplastic-like [Lolium perenne]
MAGISKMANGNGKKKGKVVVVMGATATGKSKLAVDLALRFGGEVVNTDKVQVHDGLDVVTNKATAREQAGVPHHLIGGVHPDADYSVSDFCRDVTRAVESVVARGRVPVLAGGSNRYLEALLDGGGDRAFRARYDICFLWVDADLTVLDQYVRDRVDCMVEQGLVAEVREFYSPDADYSRGIRRAIGVPEMDAYFRLEAAGALDGDDALRTGVLTAAVDEIKENTCGLVRRQLRKIHRFRGLPGWSLRRLDVTRVLALKVGEVDDVEAERAAWEADAVAPATWVVKMFLGGMLLDGGSGDMAAKETVIVAGAGAVAESCGLQLVEAAPSRGFHGRKAAAAV